MTPSSESEGGAKPGMRVSAALLVAYVAVVAWVFYGQATSWPHEGSWAIASLVLVCPGVVYQAGSLVYTRLTGRLLKRRVLIRLVTIPVGLVFAGVLTSWASTLSMRSFEQAYAPFVTRLSANPAEACHSAVRYFGIPSVAAYNLRADRVRPIAKLWSSNKRFLLSFDGGSIDIDGSTIYYDSSTGAWRKFHNDNGREKAALAKLTQGLPECMLRES